MIRSSARLAHLTQRTAVLVERTNPLPEVAVLRPADADHPPVTRIVSSLAVDVYYDPAAGEPDLPPLSPSALVIRLHP